ncbi:hypothetical protein BC827DRAFT_1153565 [Russula dissimulans]|nr:hypothetical protein BC827DRAFT_1153565 [Russula dissimulans]
MRIFDVYEHPSFQEVDKSDKAAMQTIIRRLGVGATVSALAAISFWGYYRSDSITEVLVLMYKIRRIGSMLAAAAAAERDVSSRMVRVMINYRAPTVPIRGTSTIGAGHIILVKFRAENRFTAALVAFGCLGLVTLVRGFIVKYQGPTEQGIRST